ncbi:DNA repair and recombination protein RAD52 [Nematocida homosporus]|uniref:DNA repair and recombination protein RAD52 n=1 Tax=Nematocida homosporus TaxID=1912981 RepID=UPI002220B735|nr:DNA repair and recombination protein RAD52 [Nematocida homosporus]KAI5187104.1 DNA repair and recombination protein RAD52 [Nematocida homosporus]
MTSSERQQQLNKFLGPEYIKFRNTGYTEEAYVEGWAIIQVANRIFGFDGWSSEIKKIDVLAIEEYPDERYTVTVSAIARVILKDGTYREDMGVGSAERIKGKGKAFKQAHKSAITDSLKRALRQFGTALGSCCYDKHYASAIKKIKPNPQTALDENNLIRPNRPLSTPSSSTISTISTSPKSTTTPTPNIIPKPKPKPIIPITPHTTPNHTTTNHTTPTTNTNTNTNPTSNIPTNTNPIPTNTNPIPTNPILTSTKPTHPNPITTNSKQKLPTPTTNPVIPSIDDLLSSDL